LIWLILSKCNRTIASLSPDLILLDLNLPCVSGFQICREIKQKSAIPVLVLTSRDQMKDELHALKLGADEYLTNRAEKNACLPGWQMFSNVMKAVPIFWRAPIFSWTVRHTRCIFIISLLFFLKIRENYWKFFNAGR